MVSLSTPFLREAMREVVLQEVDTYLTHRQNTARKYIAMQTIMDLCEQAEQRPVSRVSKCWWEQEGINLDGTQVVAETVSDMDEADRAAGQVQMDGMGGGLTQ